MTDLTARELLSHLYHCAIEAVDGRHLAYHWCKTAMPFKYMVAIGKAAPAMLQGALEAQTSVNKALLICPRQALPRSVRKDKRIAIHAGTHPVPDAASLAAGDELLSFLAKVPAGESLLFLISGGTSSLVEIPVQGLSLDDVQAIYRYLLASGKDIHLMNAWRKCFSRIKGGGLLNYVDSESCAQILISDVQGDDPASIGSGLLSSDSKYEVDDDVWLREQLEGLSEVDRLVKSIDSDIIGSSRLATTAVFEEARQMELDCHLHEEFLDGDALEQGAVIGHYLKDAEPGVHIWGGETTVKLPDNPGVGGRNQAFALAAAQTLINENDIIVLAAGTDGIDGNTDCAGAIVHSATIAAAEQMGFDVEAEIQRANSGKLLMATGDLFKPGPTNTNVMDLVIAYKR